MRKLQVWKLKILDLVMRMVGNSFIVIYLYCMC